MITLSRTGAPFANCELPPASKDYDPLPYYLEPVESPNDAAMAAEYPLTFTSGRVPAFHHSTLRNNAATREITPVPELLIHPEDAAVYKVASGDWVWVESKRGKTRGLCKVTRSIRPGSVFMERFWAPENLNPETHGWREMNINILTKASAPFNDVVGTYTLRAFQVKVYKAVEGAPVGVWTKPEDLRAWLPKLAGQTEPLEER
jgi:anaerobic selenocysteine-containing dehydrogenase